MRRHIGLLIQIATDIPDFEINEHAMPGYSLYLFPKQRCYEFDLSGKGYELDALEAHECVEIPLVCNGHTLNKNIVLMVLNAALSETSLPTQSKLALRGVYHSSKFS
jgi:hypothetical protein